MLDLPGNIVKSIYALMLSSADPQPGVATLRDCSVKAV
ncbi:hypothetical protein (plasmid) [Acinetobacter baumannii]|nr:hypothetical protein [Acinetobacter baumannii]QZX59836.1 hypothetical protein [Acinetobacter baumannii]